MKAARTRHCRHRGKIGRGIIGLPGRLPGQLGNLGSVVSSPEPRSKTNLVHFEPYRTGPAEAQCAI